MKHSIDKIRHSLTFSIANSYSFNVDKDENCAINRTPGLALFLVVLGTGLYTSVLNCTGTVDYANTKSSAREREREIDRRVTKYLPYLLLESGCKTMKDAPESGGEIKAATS